MEYTKEQIYQVIELARKVKLDGEICDIEDLIGFTELQTNDLQLLYTTEDIIKSIVQ